MIEMKLYRDDEYVYINNPDGTTKRVPIENFESAISGEGGASNFIIHFVEHTDEETGVVSEALDKTWMEIYNAMAQGVPITAYAVEGVEIPEGDNAITSTNNMFAFIQHNINPDTGVENYNVAFSTANALDIYSAHSPNDYPVLYIDD